MSQASAARPKPFPPGMPVGPGDVIAGKYRVDAMVAVGGMGVVVVAKHLQLGQDVAIKVLLPAEAAEGSQAVPRFLREARAAAGLRSDHVVRIYDVDTLPTGLPYMVMELLSGRDLRRVVKTSGPLSVEESVEFVLQAADAIGQAHEMGIVHRDLKPSNLFLTERSDGKALVKVLDFGISKASHDPLQEGTLTTTRAMMGSPMYMSPEQVRDAKSVDGRSDIWALGVILHELLAGKAAFRGDSLPAICAAIAADPPASLRAARPDVSPELEAVVLKCLQKDAAHRYQTVAELKQALLPFSGRVEPPGGSVSTSSRLKSQPAPSPRAAAPSRESLAGETVEAPLSAPGAGSLSGEQPGSLSREQIETLPTQRFERSDPDSPTVSYNELLSNPEALRPPPLGIVPSDAPFAATGFGTRSARSRSALLGLGALVLVLAGATVIGFSLRGSGSQDTAGTAAPAVAPASSFKLRLRSEPPNAEVFEGDRLLGKTPIDIELDRARVAEKPRLFRLELAGYEPFEITQGPSDSDVEERRPKLEPKATAAAASSTPAASSASGPRRVTGKGKPSTPSTAPDNSPKPSTDIRLSR